MPEDERAEHRRLRKKKQHEQVQEEVHVEVHKHEQPDEVLEFPTVTPEEELEFLTFYYNTLGTIYQSSGAAVIASGQTPGYNAPGVDGVRWGRMRVVPCPASSPEVSVMLQGITGNSFVATAVTAPPYAANLATSILEEEEPEESEEDYIASSPHDLSNSSDSRALIALWQAKRAHDLYLALREEEKQRAQAEAREAERQAKGKANGGAEEEDEDSTGGGGIEEMESNRDSSGAGGPDGQGGNLNTHTTLGLPGFSSINIPNLSLAQLQSESRALGLFGFPHISNLGSVGGPAQRETQAQGLSTQSRGESESNLIFWSTQPIVLPQQVQQKQPTESQKALGMTQQFAERQAALLQAGAAAAGPGAAQKLINPYTMCSAADAATYSNLGATLYHLGNFPLALRCFFVALQIRLATIRPQEDEYIDVATSLNNLGVVLSQLQYYQPAWEYFSAAHDLARGRLDPVHPRLNLIANNLAKIRPRRQAILQAPGIIQQLRAIAEAKEMKEHIAREKRNAKAAKKGAKGEKPTARKTARPLKKGEEVPKEFHEDTRFFRPPVDGQAPVVPKPVEGAPPGPLGSAAAAIQVMPLRQFDVEMSTFGKLMLEFGPAKKKAKAAGGKKKGGKK
jgi:tetratricopeptide (TPR) repeat protein